MTPCLRVAPGVQFTVIAPAGFVILAALLAATRDLGSDLTITSACDGTHSGPNDPHHRGEAYDVRSHTFADVMKRTVLETIMGELGIYQEQDGGFVTDKFFGWLEQAGQPNEHFHVQLRHGVIYG